MTLGKSIQLEDLLSVLVVKTIKAVRSVTVVTTLFAGNIQKMAIVSDDQAAG